MRPDGVSNSGFHFLIGYVISRTLLEDDNHNSIQDLQCLHQHLPHRQSTLVPLQCTFCYAHDRKKEKSIYGVHDCTRYQFQWQLSIFRERKIPGSNPAGGGIFSGSSHTSDFKIGTPVATLPGAWRYRVSTGTGRPGVSIL